MPYTEEQLRRINEANARYGEPPLKRKPGRFTVREEIGITFAALDFLLDLCNLPVMAVVVIATNFFHPVGWWLLGTAMLLGILAHVGLVPASAHVGLLCFMALWWGFVTVPAILKALL